MFEHVKQVLGPTLGKDEMFVLNNPTECPIIQQLQDQLVSEAESVKNGMEKEIIKRVESFSTSVEEWTTQTSQQGVRFDTDLFKQLIQQEINQSDQSRTARLNNLRSSILDQMNADGVVYAQLTAMNASTGRITVNSPALQSLPSSVRQSILPQQSDDNGIYYLDFNSMEPSVLAGISKDEALITDIRSGDLYRELTHNFKNLNLDDNDIRDKVKQLFLATFMYGGDIEYHLNKLGLNITSQHWVSVMDKYKSAKKLITAIKRERKATSILGNDHDFGRTNVPVFNRYLQSEAANIFKLVLLELKAVEDSLSFKTILPIHDAVIIESKSEQDAKAVAGVMERTFNSVFDINIASVSIQTLKQEEI